MRGILILAALVAGIGAGAGVAYLIHMFNPVFLDVSTLRRVTMRPVLGAVSKTWLDRGKVVRRMDISSFAIAGMCLVAVFLGTILFQDLGVEMMQQIRFQLSG